MTPPADRTTRTGSGGHAGGACATAVAERPKSAAAIQADILISRNLPAYTGSDPSGSRYIIDHRLDRLDWTMERLMRAAIVQIELRRRPRSVTRLRHPSAIFPFVAPSKVAASP